MEAEELGRGWMRCPHFEMGRDKEARGWSALVSDLRR